MATAKNTRATNVTPIGSRPKAPEGMQRVSGDVSAFWDPASGGALYGRLLSAKDTRNKRKQIVRIYSFELLAECQCKANGEAVTAKIGDVVGVWGSAGLADLDQLGGCKVWLYREGKKDLGNGQTMWTFDMQATGTPKPLRVRLLKAGEVKSDDASDDDQIEF